MWKINISVEDATEISDILKTYQNLLPVCDSKRNQVADLKARLDDLIVVVQEENKIVADYIEQIKAAQSSSDVKVG